MILKGRYNKIMDNIQVTEVIHDRIMRKIDETDFTTETTNRSSYYQYRRIISIAACLAIICIGIIGGKLVFNNGENLVEQVVPDIVEYNSIVELSQNAGFEISEVKNVPFSIEKTTYTLYWGELAEITYSNDEEELVYRKAVGNEDISGNYNEYSMEKKCKIDDYEVTIKGDMNGYTLAVWQKDSDSYSLEFSKRVSEMVILDIIKELK
ncbi:hypothetical protein SAMN02746066_00616 [Anaerosporobacter mobilis DSM 15930]|jgi:hypothetical protein|uniref:DUF4367 domain-containing protein n=1 Tax=Anaerosporobacter mobilis DSM 15930 TaxID=1120996 RepID=A0A1M7FRS6_9FIRM|nr:hypothetical protein SAMN02746066_00616 [Anaerosporobacter mobilis DSM 15930]